MVIHVPCLSFPFSRPNALTSDRTFTSFPYVLALTDFR